jgi:hypothetical protein
MKTELDQLQNSMNKPILAAFYFLSFLLVVAYIVLYQFTPLESGLNDALLNSIITLGAFIAAFLATTIYRCYLPDEQPRRIWLGIMGAGWAWFLGELSWQIIAQLNDEVPVPSIADFFWILGFLCFTFAFNHQYAIVNPSQKDSIRTFAIGAWLVALLIPALYLTFTKSFTLSSYIEFYYPFADLGLGIAGLALVFIFRGGALMRPWIGLMVFGLSDLLYAWAEKTDLYAVSAESGNLLSLVIDTTYLAAYLILGIGFLGQWVLLKYGVQSLGKQNQPPA